MKIIYLSYLFIFTKINKKMSYYIKFFILTILFFSCQNKNDILSIQSPNSNISLEFTLKNGIPIYSIKKHNKVIINESKLGIILKDGIELINMFKIKNQNKKSFNTTWEPLYGEEKIITNNYNQLNIELQQNEITLKINFKIYNDGIGFRYEVPNQSSINNYDIIDEKTEFNLSKKDSAWWIPAFSYRRYEFLYANTLIDDISKKNFSKYVEDISYDTQGIDAAQTPLTIKKNNGIFISIHEADLTNYSSMTLAPRGNGSLEAELYPWSDGTKVKLENKILTPWRTIQIADNSSDLLNSNLILNLNDDPDKNIDYSWVKPGKYMGIWWEMIGTNQSSWGSGAYHGATTDKIMKYIKLCVSKI